MKTLIALFLTTLSIYAAAPVFTAQESAQKSKLTLAADGDSYYHAGELNVDSYVAVRTTDFDNHRRGLGFGATYFVTPNSGLRLDTFTSYIPGRSAIDIASASYVYRIPINKTAPYGVVGGDYDAELRRWGGHVGVGVEHRFVKNFSVFVEALGRKSWDVDRTPAAEGRAGIRFAF